MKKVLSLVLAFAMILGSFGFVFGSDFSDVKDTEYYSEPVNVLSGLGVIAGFPDGTFGPEKEVTRAQMATMIVNCLGMTVNGPADTKFSDVPKSHWASGFVNYAASVGFIAGYPDGTFKPDQQVTYDQALTMIVAALGYTADSLPGTWPGSFVNKARGLGILDICKTTGSANAPRQDIACFLYNALGSPIGYVDKDGTFQKNVGADGVTGSDTMMARLGATPLDVNGDKKIDENDFFVVTGSEDSDINLQNYLGASVTAYVNKDGDIIAIKEVRSEYIEGAFADLDDEYTLNDNATDATFFENGDENGTKKLGDFDGDDTNLKVAVKLNGKKVTKVYSIQAWTPEATFMFTADMADEIIDDKTLNTEEFVMDDDDEIDGSSFAMVGRDTLADLKEDDVVTVYLHKSGTDLDKIVKIEVGTETVSGVISKINAKETAFTIGGTAYGKSDDPTAVAVSDLRTLMEDKTEAKFFLDYAGNIYDYDTDSVPETNYAVVLACGGDTTRYGSGVPYVKMFLIDGTTAEFEVDPDEYTDAALTGTDWAYPIDPGTFVEYTLDEDVIIDFVPYDGQISGEKVDKNGVVKTFAFTGDTTAISYTGFYDPVGDPTKTETEMAKAANYALIEASKLYDNDVDEIFYFEEDNNFKAVMVIGGEAADDTYAIFVKLNGTDASGELWTALYDGEVKDFTVKSGKVADADVYTTPDAVLCLLTFNSDEVVTAVDDSKTATGEEINNAAGAITVSGNVITDGNSKKFSMDEDAVAYMKGSDGWAAKALSAVAGRKNAYSSVYAYDPDGDGDYDIVIVIK